MRKANTLLLFLVPVLLHAQGQSVLYANDVRALFNANGMIGRDPATGASFFVPALGDVSPLYSANLWVGGLDGSNALHLAATEHDQQGHDFFPGPLTVGSGTITSATSMAYDRVWSIQRQDVERQCAYFSCMMDPDCDETVEFPKGWVTPSEFMEWPAHGNVSEGQAFDLAPYNDFNANGYYDPENGDAPCVPGDQALYAIYNDKLTVHTSSGGQAIGLEIHMMPFAYASNDPAIAQTVFVHYRIFNRGDVDLHDAYIGLYMDPDLGCATDDHMQCDVARNLIMVRNSDNTDEDCSAPGYGAQPPAFGALVIQGPRMDANGLDDPNNATLAAFTGANFGNDVVDDERLGLGHFMANTASMAQSQLNNAGQFYNRMKGLWADQVHLTYGANGYAILPDAVPTRFAFPGTSDPAGLGTDGQPMPAWTEAAAGNMPGDRRGVAAMGPLTLAPGAEQDLLVAFIHARATSGGVAASVQVLQQRADIIKAFGEDLLELPSFCPCSAPTGIARHDRTSDVLQAYPVPAGEAITLRTLQAMKNADVHVFDATGKTVARSSFSGRMITLPVQGLAPGIYHVSVTSAGFRSQARFVKQ